MGASVVSFEQKAAAIVKSGTIDYDGEHFRFAPQTNIGYKIFRLRKGYVRINKSIEGLIDGLFENLCAVEQKPSPTAVKV